MPTSKEKAELRRKIDIVAYREYKAQLQPSTFVHLSYIHLGGVEYHGVGFAKVCHPDKWDSDRGHNLARKKAVAHIVRQIMDKQEQYDSS